MFEDFDAAAAARTDFLWVELPNRPRRPAADAAAAVFPRFDGTLPGPYAFSIVASDPF